MSKISAEESERYAKLGQELTATVENITKPTIAAADVDAGVGEFRLGEVLDESIGWFIVVGLIRVFSYSSNS